jgi:hypothetical protein
MSNERDWLLRPVRLGMCRYESLTDGALSLDDVADMNEALDIADENQRRYTQSRERNHG